MIDYYSLPLPDIKIAIDYINDFMQHQKIRGLSKSSLDSYQNEAILFFSVIDPKIFNSNYLQNYLSDFGNISTSKFNQRASALRTILKYLVSNGFDNCSLKIHYKKAAAKLPSFLSELEIKSKIRKLSLKKTKHTSIWKGRRDYALFMFMYATGLRASEVIKFKLSDLDNNWIRVESGKGKKDRYVPIAPKAVKALEDYYRYIPSHVLSSNDAFFITDTLVPFSRITLNLHCNKVFGINPHLIRHSFATHLAINGCDINILSDFLGHSSLMTTQIYTHIQNNHLKDTIYNHFPKI